LKDRFIKIREKIYTPVQLKQYLDAYNPIDCYQTVSLWKYPQYLGIKKLAKIPYPTPKPLLQAERLRRFQDNLFLGSDFVLDFDQKDYKNPQEMQANIVLAKQSLIKLGMTKHILMRTGAGQQLLVADFWEWANIHVAYPKDREYACLRSMQRLTRTLLDIGIKWDSAVSSDTRRIMRCPNTLHRNGNMIKLIEWPKAGDYLIFNE
jgi:hypothetical protein